MNRQQIMDKAKSEARLLLSEVESKELLKEAGINVIDTRLAISREEAVSISQQLGYPVVLKIASADILHKSDSGGVKVGLKTSKQVARAYEDILKSIEKNHPQEKIQGISVQKMARPGVEVIIGMSKDAQFGPMVMFGLGGIWVELLKDVSFRMTPLARRDAAEMVREIKGFPLLTGYRGQEVVDIARLEDLILKVADFAERNPMIKELDLNPVFAYSDGAVAVDARIILEESAKA